MEVQGKVTRILNPQTIQTKSGETKTKYGFVIEMLPESKYPRLAMFEVWDDRWTEIATNVTLNDVVTVSYDINCREYNERWYTSLYAWKVVRTSQSQPAPQQPVPQTPNYYATSTSTPTSDATSFGVSNNDNLPF